MFVTFEGVDGSGKSTQAQLLAAWLEGQGHEVVATREPGGTPLGEGVRELLLEGPNMTAWAEAALFAAARAELAETVIRPALDRGAWVVCDRYIDSSVAYQGIARGLGVGRVLELNLAAVRGLIPDRTFMLLLDPAVGHARQHSSPDRIESEDEAFRASVDEAFRGLAAIFPQRIVSIDATQSATHIAELVREHAVEHAAG